MIGKAPVPVPTTSRRHFQGMSSSIESGVCPKAERNFFDGFLLLALALNRGVDQIAGLKRISEAEAKKLKKVRSAGSHYDGGVFVVE